MTPTPLEDFPNPLTSPFRLGEWRVEPAANRLLRRGETVSVEPKVMDLLALLAAAPGRTFSREELDAALWPDVVVGEDSLARAISKLRRALGDAASSPIYLETIPKRGYRLIKKIEPVEAPVQQRRRPMMIAAAGMMGVILMAMPLIWPKAETPAPSPTGELTERASDLYMKFTRADNEAAIELYERALDLDPENASAQSGLANALVQRVIRWQVPPGQPSEVDSLAEALSSGVTSRAEAKALLDRAVDMGERAVRKSPRDADALKALGFAYSAQGDLENARELYLRAIEADPNAWDVMVNLGELSLIGKNNERASEWFSRAYRAMEARYSEEPQRIGAWLAPFGVLIGDLKVEMGAPEDAEIWYRRVLDRTPFEPEASVRLAGLLRARGAMDEADQLCDALAERVGMADRCKMERVAEE